MLDYIFIRGPIGVGKTSVSRSLYDRLRLNYYNPFLLEFDRFRNENVEEQITDLNQQRAVELLVHKLNDLIESRCIPIIEGVFYQPELVSYLLNNVYGKSLRIKLFAPVDVCVERNQNRRFSREEFRVVNTWELLQQDEQGEMVIQTQDRTIEHVVDEIFGCFKSS